MDPMTLDRELARLALLGLDTTVQLSWRGVCLVMPPLWRLRAWLVDASKP